MNELKPKQKRGKKPIYNTPEERLEAQRKRKLITYHKNYVTKNKKIQQLQDEINKLKNNI